MPSFDIGGFKFFFFSNEFIGEKLEPVHIHVSAGAVGEDAPKWWIGLNGKINQADVNDASLRNYNIKKKDISRIEALLRCNSNYIINLWLEFFEGHEITTHSSVD